jgi:NAD(P)-dependent dehydrogenase (short-subunit alcohol dehydrogenase family)
MGDRLANRVIAIVGASAGIGLAAAKRFAEEGARVVMLARGKERLEDQAAALGATPIVCDVADPSAVRSAFAQIERDFGHLNALLNVAGVARVRKIEDATDDDIHFVLGVNLLGPISAA